MLTKKMILRKAHRRMNANLPAITVDDIRVQNIVNQQNSQRYFNGRWQGGPLGKKRLATDVLRTTMWKGKRCFILGGGPSLCGFDFKQLEDEYTIGINRVYENMDCSILFAMDGRFFNWIRDGKYGKHALSRFRNFHGVKFWLDVANLNIHDVFYIRAIGRQGLSWKLEEGLYNGNNSGYGALNLALTLGANPIYLLGFDMSFDKGKGHYHNGHPTPFKESMMGSFKPSFNNAAAEIRTHGIKVININRNSKLKCFEFGDLPGDIGKNKKPIYVSFYTPNGYEKVVTKLRDDIWRFTLRSNIDKVNDQGSWVKNTQYKPIYLKQMLDKYPGNPIVWVDADARIRQHPALFDNFKADIGIHYRTKGKRGPCVKELLSGTIYLANNKKTRKLLDMWIAENNKYPDKWDQRTLSTVIGGWDGVVQEIPSTYCQIFDSMKGPGVVIEHFQASREFRRRQ